MATKPEPCHCDAPNRHCRRAGAPMIEPLWQICRGANCEPDVSTACRRRWDEAADRLVSKEEARPVKEEQTLVRLAAHAARSAEKVDGKDDNRPHKSMSLEGMIRLLQGPLRSWPNGWDVWPVTMQAHRVLLEESLAEAGDYPTGQFDGRGMVIGAGGAQYFACAMVAVAMLRKTGCTLPVEFWHLGVGEIDPQMRLLAEEVGVRCVDARAVADSLAQQPRILNGWELKPFSMQHSRFEEVLYLDADNIVAADPTGLFDDPAYREMGAIFWPDLPPCFRTEWLPKRVFEVAGLSPSSDSAFESGQLLVNKRMCWRELVATTHINAHSDFWYGRIGGPDMIYGDKDTFWIAWHKAGTPYAQPRAKAGWIHPAIIQHDMGGRVMFHHCCQGKGMLAGGERVACLADPDFVATAGQELRKRWHGRPWDWRDQTPEEEALAKKVSGIYRYQRIGHDERLLEILPGGDVGAGAADCECRWTMRLLDGKPTLIVSSSNRATMLLRKDEEIGAWSGRWEHHERMPVVLSRPGP